MSKSIGRSALHQHQHQQEHLDASRSTGEEVTSINIVNKGFFCIFGGKRLYLFSKIAETWDFAKTREYIIPSNDIATTCSSVSSSTPSQVTTDKQQLNFHALWKVVVSPKEEHVLVLSSKQQIYSVSDITKDQNAESKVNSFVYSQ